MGTCSYVFQNALRDKRIQLLDFNELSRGSEVSTLALAFHQCGWWRAGYSVTRTVLKDLRAFIIGSHKQKKPPGRLQREDCQYKKKEGVKRKHEKKKHRHLQKPHGKEAEGNRKKECDRKREKVSTQGPIPVSQGVSGNWRVFGDSHKIICSEQPGAYWIVPLEEFLHVICSGFFS